MGSVARTGATDRGAAISVGIALAASLRDYFSRAPHALAVDEPPGLSPRLTEALTLD